MVVSLLKVSHDSGSVTIDPRKAERAMLIKNCAGDWGIIRALWYDPEKGKTPFRSTESGSEREKRSKNKAPNINDSFSFLLHPWFV